MSVPSPQQIPGGPTASTAPAPGAARRSPVLAFAIVVTVASVAAIAVEATPGLAHLLDGYRWQAPSAMPFMDASFTILALGAGYLCLERHRLRDDLQSAALGTMLWLAALLSIAYSLARSDHAVTRGMLAPVAPYLFLSSYLAVFLGVGLAAREGRRPFPLNDRGRVWLGLSTLGLAGVAGVVMLVAQRLMAAGLPGSGPLVPFEVSLCAATSVSAVLWAFLGARRTRRRGPADPLSGALLLAAMIWLVGFASLLILPVRDGVGQDLAALARPLGVGVLFVVLLHEQVRLSREARTRQGDLETLQAEMQASLRQLQETQGDLLQADKLKALGTLVSSMAHELNNPLTTILMSAQFLQRDETISDKVRQRLAIMETESTRAAHIIRDLLLFARRRDAERKQIDFADVLEETLRLQAPEFDLHGIRVVRLIDPALAPIWADPYQLQQVFLNLFSNAVHAMHGAHGGGTLTVRLRQERNELCLEVDDDGPGISPQDFGRIFDPFFTTKAVGEGTGLGLSLSLGIVEAHAGRMRAENLIGGGARITVRLPANETSHVAERPATAKVHGDTRGRVLVVDDNTSVRNAIGDVLATIGHEVTVAASSREATEHLARQGFDVVVVDLRLPELDGRQVWKWILHDRPALAARVLFMTGDLLSGGIEQFVKATGRPVLTKPVTVAQVRAAVQSVLTTR